MKNFENKWLEYQYLIYITIIALLLVNDILLNNLDYYWFLL